MQRNDPTDHTTTSTVLVGIDGSPPAAAAMRWAIVHAKAAHAGIVAGHVMTLDGEFLHDMAPAGFTNWRRKLDEHLRGPWTEAARGSGVPVRIRLVESDDEAGGLARLADEVDASMIIVGIHGRGNLADRLLGSTTYKLAHRTTRPVVIVPADWNPPAAA